MTNEGKADEPDWFQTTFMPQLKKASLHVVRAAAPEFYKSSAVYGLFGFDFMLDSELKLWFIEANSNPGLKVINENLLWLFTKVIYYQFEI